MRQRRGAGRRVTGARRAATRLLARIRRWPRAGRRRTRRYRPGRGTTREVAPGVHCLGPTGWTRTNCYLVESRDGWVVVDTGWASNAPRLLSAASALFGTGSAPAAILLTHDHPDHAGAARVLAQRWGCPVYVHPDELDVAVGDRDAVCAAAGPLERWVTLPWRRLLGHRRRDRRITRSELAEVVGPLDPGAPPPGLAGWRCVPTPGHTPGHVSFFRPRDRVLLSGDALVTVRLNAVPGPRGPRAGLSGPPWLTTTDRNRARRSMTTLAGLAPRVIAPGHGRPVGGADVPARLGVWTDRSVPATGTVRPAPTGAAALTWACPPTGSPAVSRHRSPAG